MGCDRGGWDERGAAVGSTLKNAWKLSEKPGRRWTDNPAHHITMLSPTALISTMLSFCLQSLKPTRKTHPLLTFACHVKKKALIELCEGPMVDKHTIH